MRTVYACSVDRADGKMWLVPSERKNAKFPAGSNMSLQSDHPSLPYMVFKCNVPNNLYLKKQDFFKIFGQEYAEYKEERVQKMKSLAAAIYEVMKKDADNQKT